MNCLINKEQRGGSFKVGRLGRGLAAFWISLILLTLPGRAAEAASRGSSWRCGGRLILPGMSQAEVLARCGDPAFVSTSEVETFRRNRQGEGVVVIQPIETWTYNPGSNQLIRYLIFRGGYLARVATGDYGY
jgi:hypothetical protein